MHETAAKNRRIFIWHPFLHQVSAGRPSADLDFGPTSTFDAWCVFENIWVAPVYIFTGVRKGKEKFSLPHTVFIIPNWLDILNFLRHSSESTNSKRWRLAVACLHLLLSDHPYQPFYMITTICTVDLLIPNSFAAPRTVDWCAIMYSPSSTARSSTMPFTEKPPHVIVSFHVYAHNRRVCGNPTFPLYNHNNSRADQMIQIRPVRCTHRAVPIWKDFEKASPYFP